MAQYLCGCNCVHLSYASASFAGGGVRIKLAPMSRLIPQEMAKNGTAAEKSRMRGRGLRTQYRTGRTLQGERNPPLQTWLDLKK